MITILFVWTVAAANPSHALAPNPSHAHREWRALAEFVSPARCAEAVRQLGLAADRARCIVK